MIAILSKELTNQEQKEIRRLVHSWNSEMVKGLSSFEFFPNSPSQSEELPKDFDQLSLSDILFLSSFRIYSIFLEKNVVIKWSLVTNTGKPRSTQHCIMLAACLVGEFVY